MILKYIDVPHIDYMSIDYWTCVADGVDVDIGIVLRVGRGDVVLCYTPSTDTVPDDNYIQNVYTTGNIFITTEGQAVWVKPVNPNFPATLNGDITYNLGPVPQPTEYFPIRLSLEGR